MPILDVDIVLRDPTELPRGLAQSLADAAGRVFHSPPGTTWVRVRPIPADCYAENEVVESHGVRSVIVSVLKARNPVDAELIDEIRRLTDAIATACGRAPEQVHLLYLPEAAGRIAFGGQLVPC